MTLEQKAKAYDETIEKLRNFYRDYDTVSCLIDVKEELANRFPELKESEDEIVRKWIIDYLNNRILNSSILDEKESCEKALAWLEKQGEKGTNGNKRVIPNSTWSEEDECCINQLIVFCENCMVQDSNAKKCASWLKDLRPQNTWKPSKEQLHYLYWIANVRLGDSVVEQEVSKHLNELYNDLKKLKG